MRFAAPIILLLVACLSVAGQELKTRNVIIVTLDGYRWKELFEGADSRILLNPKYNDDPSAAVAYNGGTVEERRSKLMPFFWNVIAREGQLYGNRSFKNKVNCSNNHLLSYPGYSEMFVGYAAKGVSGNDKKYNPNPTVFEYLVDHGNFDNQIAAFGTWDVFDYILREKTSNIYVNCGKDHAHGKISSKEKVLNESTPHNGPRPDQHTFDYAMEYLKREKPRVLFLGFDETDQHGHGGRYDDYLRAAQHADEMIGQLWEWIQSDPQYKDQTTLFITTDHGRGSGKNWWKDHRLVAPGSRHIWFAVMGPDTPPFGEMRFKTKYYQKQVAKTIAAFLGVRYEPGKPVGEIVQTMVATPLLPETDVALGPSKDRGQ